VQPQKGQHRLGGNTTIASDRIGKDDMRLTDVYGHVISDVLALLPVEKKPVTRRSSSTGS